MRSLALAAIAAFSLPYGVVHSATNVGTTNAAELGTYVVEKGKPLVEWVK